MPSASFGIPTVRPASGSRVERIRLDASEIPALFARLVAAELAACIERDGSATLCVSFAEPLRSPLRTLARLDSVPFCLVSLYFGDNRGAANDAPGSTSRSVIESFAEPLGIPESNWHAPRSTLSDFRQAVQEYEASLPPAFDVLVLSAGPDGRVAGLLPHSPALRDDDRRVAVLSEAPPPGQYTLTGRAIVEARCTIVLATGLETARAVAEALEGTTDPERCPARLARNAVWLMDHEAASALTGSWPDDSGAELPSERPNTR